MKSHILLAEWNNLVMANYEVPKELLLPFVPYKTELDFFEGNTYVSLIGFMFLNITMHGISIPFHTNFEEVNLRFYVKYNNHGNWKKGVVFIKEIVPKPGIAFVANNIFGGKYATMKMKHFHIDSGQFLEAGYEWKYQNKWNKLSANANKKSVPIGKASHEEFIADHYWGFTKYSDSKTYEYEIEHPQWETLEVISHTVNCNFAALYGEEFSLLNNAKPKSVFMIKGSEVRLHQKRILE